MIAGTTDGAVIRTWLQTSSVMVPKGRLIRCEGGDSKCGEDNKPDLHPSLGQRIGGDEVNDRIAI